jgi:hypothetical protein
MPPVNFDFQYASSLCDEQRWDYLRSVIDSATSSWKPGCTSDFEFLQEVGFDPHSLQQLRTGFHLPLVDGQVEVTDMKNHPSFTECQLHASEEWRRLEALGKVVFHGRDSAGRPIRPAGLHVIPIGGVVKERKNCEHMESFLDRFKLRLIIDLKKGRVNSLIDWDQRKLSFGTLEQCIARLKKNGFQYLLHMKDFFQLAIGLSEQFVGGFLRSCSG